MSAAKHTIAVAAGGTGGHLFPASALAEVLTAHGHDVHLVTDARARDYGHDFPAVAIHAVNSATPSAGGVLARGKALFSLAFGLASALMLMRRVRPSVVVGFGGYPSVPPVMAAQLLGIPTVIHEQNAVMGRANRLLAHRASLIATGFPELTKANPKWRARQRHVGNPVRLLVREAVPRTGYAAPEGGQPVRLLVFGGSQGARVMSEVVPAALAALPKPLRTRIHVVHQARDEDLRRAKDTYEAAGIASEVAPFFDDLPARMADAHLVIARSGASTIAELAVIGRPSVLVPLPGSLDQDQRANAEAMAAAGGATVLPQEAFSPQTLATLLLHLLDNPEQLAAGAVGAKTAGVADAAERLAALVASCANREALP